MRPLFVVGIRHRPSPRELPSFHKYLHALLLTSKRRRESKSRGQTNHKLLHDNRLRSSRAKNALFRGKAQFLCHAAPEPHRRDRFSTCDGYLTQVQDRSAMAAGSSRPTT
jgi:hypothetical protein